MLHALMYHGGFERNFPALRAGAASFEGSDGTQHRIPDWPADVGGARVGYMEKAGKNFFAVRVQDDESDIVLQHGLLLDPPRHMGYGKRFSAEPAIIDDEVARVLLDDMIGRNPEQRAELTALRDRVIGERKPKP